MKAIVHLGLPKTGTTTLQSWLRLNEAELGLRGVGYDRMALPGKDWRRAHVELGIGLAVEANVLHPHQKTRSYFGLTDLQTQDSVATEHLNLLQKTVAAAGHPLWIFSCEDLGSLIKSADMAAALDRWMKRSFDDVHYVVYLRRQEDQLLSRYSQVLRRGETKTLDEFVESGKKQNFYAKIKGLREAVGPDAMSVRLLEGDMLVDGDLIADFASVCGFDPTGLKTPDRKNEAFSIPAAEFVRRVNMRWPSDVPGLDRPNPFLGNLLNTLTSRYSSGRKMHLTQAQIDSIRAANAKSNAKLCQDYFPGRAELFPPKAPVDKGPRQNQARLEELMDIALDVYQDVRLGDLEAMQPDEIAAFRAVMASGGPQRGKGGAKRAKGGAKRGKVSAKGRMAEASA